MRDFQSRFSVPGFRYLVRRDYLSVPISSLGTLKKPLDQVDIILDHNFHKCLQNIMHIYFWQVYFYKDDNQFVPASNRRLLVLQYLDLDLDTSNSANNCATQAIPTNTVYKTVDFIKTDAFNRTRQKLEEERKQCTDEFTWF